MKTLFGGIYNGKTVLVTGHTGFKGSWLSYWLQELGANVIGYSLNIPTSPSHIELLDMNIVSIEGDIRDQQKLNSVFEIYKPDIVFHLAAQPLVRYSYINPVETYEVNVIGTLKVFEACRQSESVRAIVNITSDKAYENKEWVWGYRETDPMGGYDPYSASKGCAELVTSSYRNSYFNLEEYGKQHHVLLASCRSGNVIGGGDWGKDRLIPDIMTAANKGERVLLRNPDAIRPWQHVLEPLSGYLLLGWKLFKGESAFAEGWNFGPSDDAVSVKEVVEYIRLHWNKVGYEIEEGRHPHEANMLKLDCSKARSQMHWSDVWDIQATIEKVTKWYQAYYEKEYANTYHDLYAYIEAAKMKKIVWTVNA